MEPSLPAATAPGLAGRAGSVAVAGVASAGGLSGTPAALAVAVGRELAATVASSADGALLLRVAGGVVQASGGAGLVPGMQVRLRVTEAAADRIVLQVLDPAAAEGAAEGAAAGTAAAGAGDLDRLLRGRLALTVGGDAAGALARALGARGAPAGETAVLAARFLAGDTSPVALLRSLATGKPGLAGLLAEAERLVASGNGPALREALSLLGLDAERRKRAGAAAAGPGPSGTGAAATPTDVKAALAGAPEPVSAQQLLLRPLGPALLFLPLPGGGEARVTIDDGAADPLKPLSVQLDLDLPRLGRVGIRLLGHDGALWASVATADPAAAAALAGAAPSLEQALVAATGRPTRVSVSARAPEPAVVAAQADIYA